ncbi:hypothetical protein ACGFZP_05240 [Kitasatospora sp. NPDC048239]|uniref:hypothetical protein n=1 Tax=Kitasatospora sp. NPDC048239 TaxID=3364046 RepID=UPI00370FFB22
MTAPAAVAGALMVAGSTALVLALCLAAAEDDQDPQQPDPVRADAEHSDLIPGSHQP